MPHDHIEVEVPAPVPVVVAVPAIAPVEAEVPVVTPISVEVPAPTAISVEVPVPVPISVDVVPVIPISVDFPAVTPIVVNSKVTQQSFVGDAVTLFHREVISVPLTGSPSQVYSETFDADFLADGRWLDIAITGQIPSGGMTLGAQVTLQVFFGSASFIAELTVPVTTVDGTGGFVVNMRLYANSTSKQLYIVKGGVTGDGDSTSPTVERCFATDTDSSLAQTFTINISQVNITGAVAERITIYLYDQEASAAQTAGLTALDRAKLDSVEWNAEPNRTTDHMLWSYCAVVPTDIIQTVPGSGLTWQTVKKGLIPRFMMQGGGIIEIAITGIAEQPGGAPPQQIQFKLLQDGLEIPSTVSGNTTIVSSQAMASIADYTCFIQIYQGTLIAGRVRMNALLNYQDNTFAFVQDPQVEALVIPFFSSSVAGPGGVVSPGIELELQVRANDNANIMKVDGSYAAMRAPFLAFGGANRYHAT